MTTTATELARQIQGARDGFRAGRCPLVMGIVNVTPDSFSDGGCFSRPERAVEHALQLVAEGADILDIGGESTRPGAASVGVGEELDRVLPVIEALSGRCDTPISIDTSKPEVMRAAVSAGASMINDVQALRAQGALAAAVDLQVPVCLMHMQGEPRTMQQAPEYQDVVAEVGEFLDARIEACLAAGLQREFISVDPGFGFGKTLQHNLALLRELDKLSRIGAPLLIGLSRKSMLGALTGRERAQDRVAASVAAAVLAAERGAAIVRVHDVGETVDALKVAAAVMGSDKSSSD